MNWIVWCLEPGFSTERVACNAMLDAVRAWAERQHRYGRTPRDGTEVLVHGESDATPRQSTCRVRLAVEIAPVFRPRFIGLGYEQAAREVRSQDGRDSRGRG